jgi:hypothetical protein
MYHVLCWFIILFRLLSVFVTFYSEFQKVITPYIYVCVCIKILNYVTNAPTLFGASAPSSGIFDIAFAKVTKY